MASLDAVVMGRKTWEQAKTFEEVPFAGKQVFVFSGTSAPSNDERIRLVHGDVAAIVADIRGRIRRNLWLVGGGKLTRQFIAQKLID